MLIAATAVPSFVDAKVDIPRNIPVISPAKKASPAPVVSAIGPGGSIAPTN